MKNLIALLGAGLLAIGASTLPIRSFADGDAGYVAHEWGTFTSVQGADGEQLDWNPLNVSELPKFVYDRNRRPGRTAVAALSAGKTAFLCRQRLETPVIYFYSAQPRTVDVAVTFPSGTITEWFPRDTPAARNDRTAPALRWSGVQIVPRAGAAEGALPLEKSGSHYYAARETDSDFVRVAAGAECETEKFLFYRGVGNFDAPLKVTSAETGGAALTLENCGKEELGILFVCEVRPPVADSGPQFVVTFQRIEKLPAGKVQTVKLIGAASSEDSRSDLAAQLRDALTAAGLYRAEAAAMVRTWEDSWLGEPGVRVLYILPRAWTDGILPLQFTPAPRELSRVMVGRAEVLMPAAERALATELQRFRSRDQGERATAIGNIRALGFGRFLEAAVRRFAATHSGDRELSNAGWQVLELASARPPVATHP